METESLGSEISLLNDEISSLFGVLFSLEDTFPNEIEKDLRRCQEYHMNLLAAVSSNDLLNETDLDWVIEKYVSMRSVCKPVDGYIYPNGCMASSLLHFIRAKTRSMIRLIYRMEKEEQRKIPYFIEFANMLSNYYFYVALRLNEINGIDHTVFKDFISLIKKG